MSLWITYVTRLNGVAAVLACSLCSLIGAWRERHAPIANQLLRLFPYALFGVLLWLSYQVLPVPTSNLSDLGKNTIEISSPVVQGNLEQINRWVCSFFSGGYMGFFYNGALPCLFLLLSLLGIFRAGFQQNLHLTLYLIGSLIGICSLRYTQFSRYLLPLYPLILLFVGYGFQSLSRWAAPYHEQATQHMCTFFTYALPVMAATLVLLNTLDSGIEHFLHRGEELPSNNAYSTEAVDMYRYIYTETPSDSVIAFFNPRGLYLNTQRVSYYLRPLGEYCGDYSLAPSHDLERDLQYADYFLLYLDGNNKNQFHTIQQLLTDSGSTDELMLVRTNKSFDLYQRIRSAE